ncbi:MAG TPA: hypothetical protein VLA87_12905 [Gaiellaceae bacterium]|nr:hypothetical protein [Gaiellaceae bacterium]
MARLLVVAALVLLAVACGEDKPTEDDAATLKVMLSTSANVQRAVQPLYFCFPEDPECYRQAGAEIVSVVAQARTATETVIAETDDACLRQAATLYRDSLDAYGDAGRAAAAGDAAAADAAILETTRLEIAYGEKIGECGFDEGKTAEYASALRESDVKILRLSQELAACRAEACVLDVAARMKAASAEAVAAVDSLLAVVTEDDEAPSCLPPALRELRGAYAAVEKTMQALGAGNLATLEREGRRAGELQVAAQEKMAACISSAGF